MLTIIYGDVENSIYNTNVYFKNTYEPEWLETELAKQMIKDVDGSDVVSGECINSSVLGQIPPERLSGGVKTLLLILNEPDRIFNASTCGNNCAKWILEIGKQQDVTIKMCIRDRTVKWQRRGHWTYNSGHYGKLSAGRRQHQCAGGIDSLYGRIRSY